MRNAQQLGRGHFQGVHAKATSQVAPQDVGQIAEVALDGVGIIGGAFRPGQGVQRLARLRLGREQGGLGGIAGQARSRLQGTELVAAEREFLVAVADAMNSVSSLLRRYAEAARQAVTTADPARRAELEASAARCMRVSRVVLTVSPPLNTTRGVNLA